MSCICSDFRCLNSDPDSHVAIEMNSIKRIIPEGSIICVTIAPKQMNEKNPIFHQIG